MRSFVVAVLLGTTVLGTTLLSPLAFAAPGSENSESTSQKASAIERAEPGKGTGAIPASVSGDYVLDKNHASVLFKIRHMGFSDYTGRFNDFDAKLKLDATAPEKSQLEATIQTASVDTHNAKLEGELKAADVFDAEKFPTMSFVAKIITLRQQMGTSYGEVVGDLTFHGVTKPVTLMVSLVGYGKSPMGGDEKIGFAATGILKRSEFGVDKWEPMVGDEVSFMINAEMTKVQPHGDHQPGQ